jgi:hypothetical protein
VGNLLGFLFLFLVEKETFRLSSGFRSGFRPSLIFGEEKCDPCQPEGKDLGNDM